MENSEVNGSFLIAQERQRQISEEGYDPEHDDDHEYGELAQAGAAYAIGKKELFPWKGAWNPSLDPVRTMTKAGALIAAEIDRLLRIQNKKSPELIQAEGIIKVQTTQIELLQQTIQTLRQEIQEMKHPRVWGYDG